MPRIAICLFVLLLCTGGTPTMNSATGTDSAVRIPVLIFHSVRDGADDPLVVPTARFEQMMGYLAAKRFQPLPLERFVRIMEGRARPPVRPVLLTFDDGYEDNYTNAAPVLRRFGFAATMFLPPGLAGRQGYVSWPQVERLRESGWDVQPHGYEHVNLTTLTKVEQRNEIQRAKEALEGRLGVAADIFCYPYGQYNRDTLDVLRELRFRFGFTIREGNASPGQPPLELKRLLVDGTAPFGDFKRKAAAGRLDK